MTYKIKCPYCEEEIEYLIGIVEVYYEEIFKAEIDVNKDGRVIIVDEYDYDTVDEETIVRYKCPCCDAEIDFDDLLIEDEEIMEENEEMMEGNEEENEFIFEIHIE